MTLANHVKGQNSKLMADQFAANGYYTIIIDLFNGDPMSLNKDPNFDFMKWLTYGTDGKNPHTPAGVDPIVEAAIKYLKEEKKIKKIGAAGYCFVGHIDPRLMRVIPNIRPGREVCCEIYGERQRN